MGMDGVELVMATEEAFGITITDAEAEEIRTPGQLVALVEGKLDTSTEPSCRSRRAFFILRRALITGLGVKRPEISPQTKLAALFMEADVSRPWETLRLTLGASAWPKLEVSATVQNYVWLGSLIVSSMLATGTFGLVKTLSESIAWWLLNTALLTLILGSLGLSWLPLPKKALPVTRQTVGDLARFLTANDPGLLAAPPEWSHERIALKVREIVGEVLGCEDRYREDARFVEDLGMD
jgi:acyl carrier protein